MQISALRKFSGLQKQTFSRAPLHVICSSVPEGGGSATTLCTVYISLRDTASREVFCYWLQSIPGRQRLHYHMSSSGAVETPDSPERSYINGIYDFSSTGKMLVVLESGLQGILESFEFFMLVHSEPHCCSADSTSMMKTLQRKVK